MYCSKSLKDAVDGLNNNINIIKDWTRNSKEIVNDYINNGFNTKMDKFFNENTPTYKGTTYRVGMIDSKTASDLKEGDYTENVFPFATSKNPEENDIFDSITNKRLKYNKDKVKVVYRINNTSVPQYDISSINPVETEVLVKPNTYFRVNYISKSKDKVIIDLSAPRKQTRVKSIRKAVPLLSASALLNIDNTH